MSNIVSFNSPASIKMIWGCSVVKFWACFFFRAIKIAKWSLSFEKCILIERVTKSSGAMYRQPILTLKRPWHTVFLPENCISDWLRNVRRVCITCLWCSVKLQVKSKCLSSSKAHNKDINTLFCKNFSIIEK